MKGCSKGGSHKNRGIDSEGIRLWKAVTQDVRPMDRDNPHEQEPYWDDFSEQERKAKPPRIADDGIQYSADSLTVSVRSESESKSREIDKNTADRLRRGKIRPEGIIDLHGMSRDQARITLQGFLKNAFIQGKRCLLVVTGKGISQIALSTYESSDGRAAPGVIKRSFPDWMNEDPLRDIVLQHFEAHPKDGGSGAYYVYLRQNKNTQQVL